MTYTRLFSLDCTDLRDMKILQEITSQSAINTNVGTEGPFLLQSSRGLPKAFLVSYSKSKTFNHWHRQHLCSLIGSGPVLSCSLFQSLPAIFFFLFCSRLLTEPVCRSSVFKWSLCWTLALLPIEILMLRLHWHKPVRSLFFSILLPLHWNTYLKQWKRDRNRNSKKKVAAFSSLLHDNVADQTTKTLN